MKTPGYGKQLGASGVEEDETVDVLITKVVKWMPLASLVVIDNRMHWLAKSQVRSERVVDKSLWNEWVTVTLWWAEKVGVV